MTIDDFREGLSIVNRQFLALLGRGIHIAFTTKVIDAILLYNPSAGRSPLSSERLQHVLNRLRLGGIRGEAVVVPPGSRTSPLLDFRNKSLLIVHGGDGTIHHALQQAVGQNVRLAVLPAGTANVLARELRIPLDLEQAIDVVLQGKTHRISLGRSPDRYFHLMAGVGFDATVITRLNPHLKRVAGEAAYWVAGLLTLVDYRPPTIRLQADGEMLEGSFAVIANARHYGGNLRVTPDADLSDNILDVCLFTGREKLRFLQYLWGALFGDLGRYPDVVYRKAHCVQVTGPNLPVQMDGEVVGQLPARFSVFDPGIEVLVP